MGNVYDVLRDRGMRAEDEVVLRRIWDQYDLTGTIPCDDLEYFLGKPNHGIVYDSTTGVWCPFEKIAREKGGTDANK